MKILKLRKISLVTWLLVSLLLGAGWLSMYQTTGTAQTWVATNINQSFVVRNYGGKCLDFGAPPQVSGSPVFIYDCNGTIAQEVRIEEVNERHDVILRVGNKVIGVKSQPVVARANSAMMQLTAEFNTETPLELQDEKNRNTVFSLGQIFALDGDSIMLASNHKLVVKVQNARGKNRTPLVLGQRNLADAEFWTFTAKDGSGRRPTSGFKRVPVDEKLDDGFEFAEAVLHATPGTVIEVNPGASIDLTDQYPIVIREGVTIRGDRRGTRLGPELRVRPGYNQTMLIIDGSDVRITGLRMRGPSRSTNENPKAIGIMFDRDKLLFHGSIIDHNDMSDWTVSAIKVLGGDLSKECQAGDDNAGSLRENVRVTRNFLHHNRMQGEGYGVETKQGGNTFIDGNTFLSNRHAIAAGGEARTIYRAWHNLVLSDAPCQKKAGICFWYTHDFDMHGTGNDVFYPSGFGGTGGQYVEIARNTFLGTNRANFDLRGEPCHLAEFHHNVSLRKTYDDAVDCTHCGGGINKLKVADTNQFNAANPTNHLGVGDFDGDGNQDLFLATGAAWYYAPAANAEWRFLNAQTDKIDKLLFGDFDADGRTDVFTQHASNWDVSWGGASRWETINVSWPILGNAAIGDFIGDERDDIFYADGRTWYVSDGAAGQFIPLDASSFRVPNLRFGDFDANGKTDVFSVVSGQWMVSYGGMSGWTRLRAKLTDSVVYLIVADFNGDRRDDIAIPSVGSGGWRLNVSYSGTGNWSPLRTYDLSSFSIAAIGRFDGNTTEDILLWKGDYLEISAGGLGTPQRQSRQDMR